MRLYADKVRRVNFVRGKSFALTAAYDSAATLPAGCGSRIGTFKVGSLGVFDVREVLQRAWLLCVIA